MDDVLARDRDCPLITSTTTRQTIGHGVVSVFVEFGERGPDRSPPFSRKLKSLTITYHEKNVIIDPKILEEIGFIHEDNIRMGEELYGRHFFVQFTGPFRHPKRELWAKMDFYLRVTNHQVERLDRYGNVEGLTSPMLRDWFSDLGIMSEDELKAL